MVARTPETASSGLLPVVFTVGHSTHSVGRLLELLTAAAVTTVADVRSVPYSRRLPQFNREHLTGDLRQAGIRYVFLGAELGGRGADGTVRDGTGRVRYELVAATSLFRSGLDRVRAGATTHRIALLCAEADPLHCHRSLLVARHLSAAGADVVHLLADGSQESHPRAEERLRRLHRLGEPDLFRDDADLLDEAYRRQSEKIAYVAVQAAPGPVFSSAAIR